MSEECLEGVGEGSGYLSDSGYCQGGMMCKQFYTNRFKLIFVSRFLFCQLPEIGHNLGCLEGAWEVSGGFLSNPG